MILPKSGISEDWSKSSLNSRFMGTRHTTSSLMYNGMLTQRASQPVAWQQFHALGHVDMVTLNEVNMVVGAVGLSVSQTTGPLGFFCRITTILKGLQRMVRSSALKPVPSFKRPPLTAVEPLWDVVEWEIGSMDALLSKLLQLPDAVTSKECPTPS